jgi:rhodanese-related sulfurtransferase
VVVRPPVPLRLTRGRDRVDSLPAPRGTNLGMESSQPERISVEEAREALAAGEAQAIDVRDKQSWLGGHVPGALHAAGDQLEVRIEELSEEQPVIVVGDEDEESAAAAAGSLRERGYDARPMEGGMKAWKDEGFTLQPSEDPELSS